MFYCTIVDDRKSSTDLLSEYISVFSNLKIYRIYHDPLKALNEIPFDKKVHFLFLDIEMPGLNGTDLARIIRNKTHYLVFTTAHNDRAAESHEVRANGYLLKPITFVTFAKLINELLVGLAANDQKVLKKYRNDPVLPYFEVKQILETEVRKEKSKKIRIDKKDFILLETQVNYVHIYTTVHENYIKVYTQLKALSENFVNDRQIVQVHRSFLVNLDKVVEHSGDSLWINVHGNRREIPIGDIYADEVALRLNNKGKEEDDLED